MDMFGSQIPRVALYGTSDFGSAYMLTFFILIALCVVAICSITLIITHLLTKSNDFGDEDEFKLRKGGESTKNIGADLGADISVGSAYSMKHYYAEDVTKR